MRATALAHPNVALIKYWGKRDEERNLPAVGSLSITLGGLQTRTTVDFGARQSSDEVVLNGESRPEVTRQASTCLDFLRREAGTDLRARVITENDFPTGAGLASSASGFAALVVAAATALDLDTAPRHLEDVCRIGSGSAPRSLYGGFVTLLNDGNGTRCEQLLTPGDWPLEIVVAVTDAGEKLVSSRHGMEQSRQTSPYYEAWVNSHEADMAACISHVMNRDFFALAELAEHSCLKMHACMMATRPPLIYWTPATLAAMQAVREMRRGGAGVFFTVDAGPQVKAVCLPQDRPLVRQTLEAIPGVTKLLLSNLGEGARQINADSRET